MFNIKEKMTPTMIYMPFRIFKVTNLQSQSLMTSSTVVFKKKNKMTSLY